jgi:dynein heavy chain, axonemal
MYALLMKYQVAVPKEESDLVSDLHYSWKKLRKLATELSNKLGKLQAGFKRELIKQVNVFVVEAKSFKCASVTYYMCRIVTFLQVHL